MSLTTQRAQEAGRASVGDYNSPGTGLHFPADGQISFMVNGQTDHVISETIHGMFVVELNILAGAGTRGVLNPVAGDLILWRAALRVVGAAATGTLDAGLAADIATASDTTFDGNAVTAAAFFNSEDATDRGTNGVGRPQIWGATQAFTATGTVGGTVGTIKYSLLCSRA